jgi:ribonuclease P protein component
VTNNSPQTLRKSEIIRSRDDIDRLFSKGQRIYLAGLTLYLLPAEKARACFIIKKDVGNAVVRNRYKRWFREIYRQNKSWFGNHEVMFYLNKNRVVEKSGFQFYRNVVA